MPRIKRWTPISHDFNRDVEVIECRKRFGDWIALAWQEMLHEGDRNEGIVKGSIEQVADRLAPISLQKYHRYAANTVQTFLKLVTDLSWIRVFPDHIQIVNQWKYHRSWERNSASSEPIPIPNLTPSSYKNTQKASTTVSQNSDNSENSERAEPKKRTPMWEIMARSMNLIPELKAAGDKLFYRDRERFGRIAVWIQQGRKYGYLETDMAAALRELYEYEVLGAVEGSWYDYADSILIRVMKDRNRDISVREHEGRKREEADNVIMFPGSERKRQGSL